LENLAVCGMIYREGEEPGLSYWVKEIFSFQDLPQFFPQESIDFEFISGLMVTDEDTDLHHAVIFVQNIASKEVLQAVYVE